jgi:hypothetical protein
MKNRIKYPRTHHVPFSPGATSDDKMLSNLDHFKGLDVVVTVKMDGENTTMYSDYIHARSLDSRSHPSQDWARAFHASIASNIPAGWRVCGENLFARHSIAYENLTSFFQAFSIWNEKNECLSWAETVEWAQLIGVDVVPVLYVGKFDLAKLIALSCIVSQGQEGWVVRLASSFRFEDFGTSVAKFVRPNHVTTDQHWKNSAIVPNKLK